MKIVFVADFFHDQVQGGAEIYDNVLISMLQKSGVKVIRLNAAKCSDNHIKLYRSSGFHFIISN